MENSPTNSRTWSLYVRKLAEKYRIPDPLELMKIDPMSKESFKKLTTDSIIDFWEKELKLNKNMKFFNTTNLSLRGHPHPAIDGATTTTLAKELRPAVKMLLNDYYTFELRAANSNNTLSLHCRLPGCQANSEDIQHVLTCSATAPVRETHLKQLRDVVTSSPSQIDFNSIVQNSTTFVQFLLDCTSENLTARHRMKRDDPALMQVFILSRKVINATHQERLKLLKNINQGS